MTTKEHQATKSHPHGRDVRAFFVAFVIFVVNSSVDNRWPLG
jgi:hypothetical protein